MQVCIKIVWHLNHRSYWVYRTYTYTKGEILMKVNIGSAVCGKVEGAKSDLANTLLTQPVQILLGSVRLCTCIIT